MTTLQQPRSAAEFATQALLLKRTLFIMNFPLIPVGPGPFIFVCNICHFAHGPHAWPPVNFCPLLQHRGRAIPGPRPTLDLPLLVSAFDFLASRLDASGQDATIIVIGGVINAMYFHTRQFTGDVDYLGTMLTPIQKAILNQAQNDARASIGNDRIPIGG